MGIVFFYITTPSKDVARKMAKHLLKNKLIACANIFPNVESVYFWKGLLCDENEAVLIAKTTTAKAKKAQAEIEKVHPYSVPCIITIPVSANKKFDAWLKKEVR